VRPRALAFAVAAAALLALPAAAVPGDPFDMRAVCRDDFQRFCAALGNEATRDAILRCLELHEPELSPACRIAVGETPEGEAPPEAPRARPRPPYPPRPTSP
jgi:hypothetical protein